MPDRRALLLVLALVLVRVVALGLALDSSRADDPGSMLRYDPARYHAIAESHGRPYRDFEVPFPPVTLAAIELVNGSTVGETMTRLGWSQLVLDLLVGGALALGWGRRAGLAYLVLGLPLLLYPFVYLRLDLVSVALALGGVALVRRGHDLPGGVLLALAVLAKIWPLALLPYLIVERRARALGVTVVTLVGASAAWVVWGGPGGPRQVLTLRGAHGWQVESVVGSLYRVLTDARVFFERGAARVGSVPGWAHALLLVALVVAVSAVWMLAWRAGPATPRVVHGLAPLAAVSAFIVLSPVLSPQYVVWFVPFVAITTAFGDRVAAGIFVAATLLTVGLHTGMVLHAISPRAADLLTVGRNALLVGLMLYAFSGLAAAAGRIRPPRRSETGETMGVC